LEEEGGKREADFNLSVRSKSTLKGKGAIRYLTNGLYGEIGDEDAPKKKHESKISPPKPKKKEKDRERTSCIWRQAARKRGRPMKAFVNPRVFVLAMANKVRVEQITLKGGRTVSKKSGTSGCFL